MMIAAPGLILMASAFAVLVVAGWIWYLATMED